MSSRPRKQRAPPAAYKIPQRRNGTGTSTEARGLADLEYGHLKIIILYDSSGPFAAPNEVCPFRCVPVPDEELESFPEQLTLMLRQLDCDACMKVHLPKQLQLDDGAEDLLLWFKETTGLFGPKESGQKDLHAHMVLPTGMAPEQREEWHFMCSVLKLHSFSRGLGSSRQLFVSRNRSASEGTDGRCKWARTDAATSAKAQEYHSLLAHEHGGHCAYSVRELEEWISSGQPLPAELARITTVRDEAEQLWALLGARKEDQILQLFKGSQHPTELAFRKHSTTGMFAIHFAVDKGMHKLAQELADSDRYPGVIQQLDSSGRTALTAACRGKHVDLVVAFMQAGARDTRNDIDALHQAIIHSNDRARRNTLNSCELTSAFRRKHLTPAHAANTRQAQLQQDKLRSELRASGSSAVPSDVLHARANTTCEVSSVPTKSHGAETDLRGRRRLTGSGVDMLASLLAPGASNAAKGKHGAGATADGPPGIDTSCTSEPDFPPGFEQHGDTWHDAASAGPVAREPTIDEGFLAEAEMSSDWMAEQPRPHSPADLPGLDSCDAVLSHGAPAMPGPHELSEWQPSAASPNASSLAHAGRLGRKPPRGGRDGAGGHVPHDARRQPPPSQAAEQQQRRARQPRTHRHGGQYMPPHMRSVEAASSSHAAPSSMSSVVEGVQAMQLQHT